MKTGNKGVGLSNDQLRSLQGKLRESLLGEIKMIDPSIVGEMSLKFGSLSDHFSDWHDVFRDNGHFTDGFGKAGGQVAEIKQSVGPNLEKQ